MSFLKLEAGQLVAFLAIVVAVPLGMAVGFWPGLVVAAVGCGVGVYIAYR